MKDNSMGSAATRLMPGVEKETQRLRAEGLAERIVRLATISAYEKGTIDREANALEWSALQLQNLLRENPSWKILIKDRGK